MGQPTIRDVARAAGVSTATVSRVLNGAATVLPHTVERVRRAVAATGFRANVIGRMLKTSRTRTLGVMVPSLRNPIFADSVEGIQLRAAAGGYTVLLACSDYRPERERATVETLLEHRVAGLLLTLASAAGDALELLRRERQPYVLMFNPGRRNLDPVVTIDNAAAAEAIVAELLARGHRRIAMIAGRSSASDRSIERRKGYERALRRRGLTPMPAIEVDFDCVDLAPVLRALLADRRPPSALFCSTDLIALAAMRGLRDLGVAIPRNMAVAGFDGIDLGTWTTPSLATVVLPARDIGATACDCLLGAVEGARVPGRVLLPFTLRDGGSWSPTANDEAA